MDDEDMAAEEMSTEDAEMMEEPEPANRDEEMQCPPGDVPVEESGMMADDPGMIMDEPPMDESGMMGEDPGMTMDEPPSDEPGMMVDEPPLDEPGMMVEEPEPGEEPPLDESRPAVPPGATLVPAPEGLMDPSTLEAHALTNSMPLKSEGAYEALKESIRENGLQQPLTRFEGKILDGRHRLRACTEPPRIPVAVMDFVGSSDDALVYVLQSNQYHHDYDTGQRATIAALLEPDISERVNDGRIEKLRRTLELKREGECTPNLGDTPGDGDKRTESCRIAAKMMRVSHGYVAYALRIQREAPELFWKVHAGELTLQAALKELNGEVDDAEQQQIKTARTRLSRIFRDTDRRMPFLERLNLLLDEFEQ